MNHRFRIVTVFLASILAIVACTPIAGTDGTQPVSADQISTIVAETLQATVSEVNVTNTPASQPETSTTLLPQPLYFLGRDKQSVSQVYRLERDGRTKTQLTFEPFSVTEYDVSLADGSIAYVASNQFLLVNADGTNRRVLIDGGAGPELSGTYTPVFSPDGKTLAYGQNGLNLYDMSNGVSKLVIQNRYGDTSPEGFQLPLELYWPERYSPDGTKLLLALGHWEAAPSHGVYDLATNTLVKYQEPQDYIYCCSFHGGPAWAQDSSSFFGVASVHDTTYQSGELWKVDASNGAVTRMLKTENGMLNLPKEIFQAPDGQLYFFLGTYSTDSGYFDAPVLELVRAAPDGVTNRVVLRSENFTRMNEALWAPDASFVIVASVPDRNWNQGGGVLELYPSNGQKSMVWLASFGRDMKWGP